MFPYWTSNEAVCVGKYHVNPGVWGVSGSTIGRIGVVAHETAHALGLGDRYDTSGVGNGLGEAYHGIGRNFFQNSACWLDYLLDQ